MLGDFPNHIGKKLQDKVPQLCCVSGVSDMGPRLRCFKSGQN